MIVALPGLQWVSIQRFELLRVFRPRSSRGRTLTLLARPTRGLRSRPLDPAGFIPSPLGLREQPLADYFRATELLHIQPVRDLLGELLADHPLIHDFQHAILNDRRRREPHASREQMRYLYHTRLLDLLQILLAICDDYHRQLLTQVNRYCLMFASPLADALYLSVRLFQYSAKFPPFEITKSTTYHHYDELVNVHPRGTTRALFDFH